jgi:alpha-L-rhamnosidase
MGIYKYRHNMKKLIILFFAFVLVTRICAQSVSPDLLTREWPAKWIAVPDEPADGYGVYLFRKIVDLSILPTSFPVHVSADNRYKLFVNGKLVSLGPARGDMYFWNYETVNLAPYLVKGKNIVAAQVWNEGAIRPEAQISWRTGFILQGNTADEFIVNTNDTWKCIRDDSYRPLSSPEIIGYYVAGPGELIDMNKHIQDWQTTDFDDGSWKKAGKAYWAGGCPKGLRDAFGWMLVPSSIPQMELTLQRLQSTREASGVKVQHYYSTMVVLPMPIRHYNSAMEAMRQFQSNMPKRCSYLPIQLFTALMAEDIWGRPA